MERKGIKLLCIGRKGILLPECPRQISDLHELIFTYLRAPASEFLITFTDQEGDECEIIDQGTYEAAITEFPNKITLKLLQKQLVTSIPYPTCHPQGKFLIKYFHKQSRAMSIFNLESENIENIEFSQGIEFKEYAAWIDLPSGEVFYCGGGQPVSSDEAYLINPSLQTFKKLPNMKYPRHSHGISYSNGAVYVFGGIQNILFSGNITKKCEKFILDDEYWEEIPDLDSPRGDVGAASKGDLFYIIGKGSANIVQFNSTEVNIDLGEDTGGCLALDNTFIYAFHGSSVKICDLVLKKVVETVKLPGKASWWSHIPPVWYGDFIYLMWWEEAGWICRFNCKTKEFEKVVRVGKQRKVR